jgi:nicotinamidase-related amidase
MTVTTLDPVTALVVIDLQKGIVAMPAVHPIAGIVASASTLTKAFRRHGLPVVLVNVAGVAPGRAEQSRSVQDLPADWFDLVPELDAQASDLLVTKKSWGAFTDTGLEEKLAALGVTQIVLAGVSTSVGVESTARQAYEAGFNVTLAIDAMSDLNREAHDNSIGRIFPRLGETGTTQAILDLLDKRSR